MIFYLHIFEHGKTIIVLPILCSRFLKFAAIGRLVLASCQSQAFEAENEVSVRRLKDKELESEDDDDSSSDIQETNDEQEMPDSGRSAQKQR